MSVKFHAHSVGNLLVGGNSITDKQKARLQELMDRKNDPGAKPLTERMTAELDELIAKRDQQFQFGATALSYIRDVWLRNEFGYDEPILTNEMLKGLMCEDEALGVLTRQVPGPFRVKNEVEFEDNWFVGTPDVVLDDAVEDVKCSWTLKTFVDVQHSSAIYYAQGQVYMHLTGRKKFRLCHILVPTPMELVLEEQKRFYFRFNCNEDDPYYQECIAKVEAMHDVSRIPEEKRIKVLPFEYDELYMIKLIKRVDLARKVYESLTLRGTL